MDVQACSIIGAGGHGKVVARLLLDMGYRIAGVYDDETALWGSDLLGHKVQGPIHSVASGSPAVIAIGDNVRRSEIAKSMQLDWHTLIHPSAHVDPSVRIGKGSVVMPHAAIQVDASVGDHAIINTSATVEHDCVINDFAHLAPGSTLAGSVNIGVGATMGVGSSAIVAVEVGAWSTVGAGAVVVRNLPTGCTASGVPARVHEKSS